MTVFWAVAYILLAIFAFLFVAVLILCLYIYNVHKKYRHLPQPIRPSFFLGHVPLFAKVMKEGREQIELLREWSFEFDGLFLMWLFWTPYVIVYNIRSIKEVTITYNLPKAKSFSDIMSDMFGVRLAPKGLEAMTDHAEWKKIRAAINPAFSYSNLKTLVSDYNNSCDKFLEKIGEMADGKTRVRMLQYFYLVTLDVIGKVAFGTDLNAIADEHSPYEAAISLSFQGIMLKLRGSLYKFLPSTFKFQREAADGVRFLRESAKTLFEERKEEIDRGDSVACDILSMLIKLADSNMITTEDLFDHIITFYLGGQETTANLLSFLLLEVTQHPAIMEKLVAEIETVLGSRDYVEFDDLPKLQYMGQVMKETLRLYPPVVFIPRETDREIRLNGHVIPVNTDVNISVFAAHRHPAHFKDPEQFDPDRWRPENSENIPRYAFFPFSMGPRNCIGRLFAQFETKVLLSRFLKRFQVTLCPDQTRAIAQETTIHPRDGVVCTIVER